MLRGPSDVGNGLDRHAIMVSLKGRTQNRQLLMRLQSSEALVGLDHAGRDPSQGHPDQSERDVKPVAANKREESRKKALRCGVAPIAIMLANSRISKSEKRGAEREGNQGPQIGPEVAARIDGQGHQSAGVARHEKASGFDRNRHLIEQLGASRTARRGVHENPRGARSGSAASPRRRSLSPTVARHRCNSRCSTRPAAPAKASLGHEAAGQEAGQARRCCGCQQDGAHRLGDHGQGRILSSAGACCSRLKRLGNRSLRQRRSKTIELRG